MRTGSLGLISLGMCHNPCQITGSVTTPRGEMRWQEDFCNPPDGFGAIRWELSTGNGAVRITSVSILMTYVVIKKKKLQWDVTHPQCWRHIR